MHSHPSCSAGSAGGIAAIRHEVIDDCSWRHQSSTAGDYGCASATTSSIRPYEGFSGKRPHDYRSAFNQLRHSNILVSWSMGGMAATYLFPPGLVLSTYRIAPVALGGPAWLLMVMSYGPMLRLYRLNPLWALVLPLAAVFYVGTTFHSAWKYWKGRGGEVKGQDSRSQRESSSLIRAEQQLGRNSKCLLPVGAAFQFGGIFGFFFRLVHLDPHGGMPLGHSLIVCIGAALRHCFR